jgi:phage pi2 protein 07|tara:strand:- start:890 stop:1345 length:456 start_codon:yes stop_codon:yes gene_type:complete
MAEVKITCPNCFSEDRCFESKMEIEDFSSYMCFNCGFTSNSLYKNESDSLEKAQDSSTELMKEISMYDYDRKIHWFPTVLNMGKLGLIYPEGAKDNWSWKFASVRELTEEEQKDPMYKGNEQTLDMENAKEYGQYEFLDACKEMGVIKDID